MRPSKRTTAKSGVSAVGGAGRVLNPRYRRHLLVVLRLPQEILLLLLLAPRAT